MSKVNQKVELVANILVVVVAVLVIGIFIQNYFFAPSTIVKQPEQQLPAVGRKLNLENVDFSQQSKTVLLALQTGCRFCNESIPFYKRMLEKTKGQNIKFIAYFPTKVENSTNHLAELGITEMEVRQAPISALEPSGTPTLIITDTKGEITDFWIGKLPPEKEAEVISKLQKS